ncbi:tail fiber/spike domain-containing protein [Cronobacter malonaticus]|uniref:tail fiber/spike domain-containing protein n=1 Tax=Cronobacter malonaticus TaxID=413503 RepID=UPI00131A1385|nr:hypothetical protein [Cronobacter malonaticus]
MSISDTNKAQKYASIAEVAAAQCKIYTEEARLAPDYTNLAKEYAESAEISSLAAQESAAQSQNAASGAAANASIAQQYANEALESAQSSSLQAQSAEGFAQQAQDSAQQAQASAGEASDSVSKTIRVSDTELSPLGNAADRQGKVLSFNSSGDVQLVVPASGSAADVLNELAQPQGADLVGYSSGTVADALEEIDGKIQATLTFTSGGTLKSQRDFILFGDDKTLYYWTGDFPKSVPALSTPSSTGGVIAGAWAAVSDSSLRSSLSSSDGAALLGYDSASSYPSGTVGEALGPFKATGGTRALSKSIRAAINGRSAEDFIEFNSDINAAINAAISQIRSEDFNSNDQSGGKVRLPAGLYSASVPITINLLPGTGGLGISLEGAGVAATMIKSSDATKNGVVGSANLGPLYGSIKGVSFSNFLSAIRLAKGSRLRIESVEAHLPKSDGFVFENLIMTEVTDCYVTSGKSHGFNYSDGVDSSGGVAYEKTSIQHRKNWARNCVGKGHILGNMSYSLSTGNGADGCTQEGYYISGKSYGLTSIGDGAEANGKSGWLVSAIRPTDEIINYRISGCYGRSNNTAGGNASMIGVIAANGGKATVIIDGVVNRPNAGASAGECIIVNGDGATARINGNADLPNGFRSTNGGYIDYTPVTIPVKKNIASGSAIPLVSLLSSQGQGHANRYAGKILVTARNAHPSATGNTNLAFYELTICKTDTGNAVITLNGEYGYAILTGSVDKTQWPAFTFTLNVSTNQLVATPKSGVGGSGTDFYFEIETSRTLYALAA